MIALLAALLLADALQPQTVTPAGTTAKNAQAVQAATNGLPFHTICDSGCGGASSFADNAAFTAGSTAVNITAGVFNDSITALTSGSAGAPRLTSKRAIHFNLRDASGNEIPFPAALVSGGFNVNVGNTVTVGGTVTANISGSISNTTFASTQGTSPWVTSNASLVDEIVAASANADERLTTRLTASAGLRIYDSAQVAGSKLVPWTGTAAGGANVIVSTALPAGSAVIGHVIHDSGSTTAVTGNVTVVQGTGTNLHAVLDTTSTTAVTQATGTNLHAVLDTTSTTAVTQATGTNLHAVLDTTSTTAVTQATAANLNAQVQGAAASGANKAGNPVQIGAVFNTTQPTVTTGQAVEQQATARGAQIVSTGVDTFNVTVNTALPAGAALLGKVGVDQTTPGTTNAVSIAQIGATTILTGGTNGSQGVGGLAADGSAVSGNPVFMAGKGFNGIAFAPRYCDKIATVTTLSTTTTVQQIAAVGSQKIYICGYYILASTATTAVTLKWSEGTGSNCVTGLANVTPAIFTTPTVAPTTANFTLGPWGNGAIPWMVTAGDALCITQSSGTNATTLSGVIFYTQN